MSPRRSSPFMALISVGSGSTVFTDASSIVWKNTSMGSGVFQAAPFTNSSASAFWSLSMGSIVTP
jgi:hypothetical protein